MTLPAVVTNDSVWYLDQTHTWASPRPTDYYAANGRPVAYELTYPPGYPLFLDLCHGFVATRHWARAVVVAQHVLSFLTALLVYGIGRRLGHPRAGAAAAALHGLYLPRLLYAQALMSETLFAFLLALGVYLALRAAVSRPGIAALAGLAVGAAATTKFQGVAAIPLLALLLWSVPARARHVAAFVGSAAAVGVLALAHNLASYGHLGMTTFTGKHLANRVFAGDALVDLADADTRYIVEQIAASGIPYVFPAPWWEFQRALRSDGSTPAEADRRILRAAWAGIRSDPWRYATNTLGQLLGNVFFVDEDVGIFVTRESYAAYLAGWTQRGLEPIPPLEYAARARVLAGIDTYAPPLRLGSIGEGWVRLFSQPWLRWRGVAAWFLVAGVLWSIAGGRALLLALLIVAVSLPGALFEFTVPRYQEPLLPLALLVSCVASAEQLRERSARRWLLLSAALLALATCGALVQPGPASYLWPAAPAALVIAGAVLGAKLRGRTGRAAA
jgi:4-amino-4-deoxy-L-arabinose transferase-like glycosyltransferase